jgi:uncharacterized protein with NRDE domain
MCLLAIQYQLIREAPILVAANREEFYERPTQSPAIQSGKPRVLCGTDLQAGGTWLGVNQHGLFVSVLNRRKSAPGFPSRSRGVLCRELLKASSALSARDIAMDELSTGKYDGANFVFADAESAWIVHSGDDLNAAEIPEGLNIIAGGDLNDSRDGRVDLARRLLTLQTLDSPVKFLAVASKVFAKSPTSMPGSLSAKAKSSIVIRDSDRGTVSSTLLALGKKPRDAIYQYAPNAPDRTRYEDYSPLLRDILSRGLRESRSRAKT